MVLCGVVASVIDRPAREKNFTIYKDTSMSDEGLCDFSTVPEDIYQHLDVEDFANLEIFYFLFYFPEAFQLN